MQEREGVLHQAPMVRKESARRGGGGGLGVDCGDHAACKRLALYLEAHLPSRWRQARAADVYYLRPFSVAPNYLGVTPRGAAVVGLSMRRIAVGEVASRKSKVVVDYI